MNGNLSRRKKKWTVMVLGFASCCCVAGLSLLALSQLNKVSKALHDSSTDADAHLPVLERATITDASGPNEKIEVVEYFSYGCPHCLNLELHFVKR